MTDPTLIYLSGPPGVGKSSIMAALTDGYDRTTVMQPFAHDQLTLRYWPGPADTTPVVAIELGRRRERFSGTDALSMGVAPKAYQWIATRPHPLILGEGDRLATKGFLNATRTAGYDVWLINLVAAPNTLTTRRAQRGSTQNDTWMRGRATKAVNLANAAHSNGWNCVTLDVTSGTPHEHAITIASCVPVLTVTDKART